MAVSLLGLVVTLLFAALGLWFSYHVVCAVRTGTANVHLDLVRRSKRPVYYYRTAVLVQAAFAVVLLLTVVRAFSK